MSKQWGRKLQPLSRMPTSKYRRNYGRTTSPFCSYLDRKCLGENPRRPLGPGVDVGWERDGA